MSGPPGHPAGTASRGDGTRGIPQLDRLIARNTAFTLLGRFAYVAGWILIAPFMVAGLGAERFGLWSLLTVVSGVYLTFDFGLQSALTKFVAEFHATGDRASLRGIFTLGILLYGGLSLAFFLAIAALREPLLGFFRVAPGLHAEAAWALVGAAAVYGVMNFYMLLSSVLSGLQRLDLWNRIAIATTLLQILGVAIVISLGGGLRWLVVNTGISMALAALWCRWSVRRLAPEIRFELPVAVPGLMRRLTRYGAALQIINLGGLVQFQLDKVLFGRFVSLTASGDYELGYRVASALWSLPALLLPALLPAVAHLDASADHARITRLYLRASRYVIGVAFPLATGIIVLSPVLFTAWLGPGHPDAARAAIALGALMGVNILTGVGGSVARGVGRPGLEAEYHVLAILLHFALSLSLIPRLGFTGGLWALFLSGAVGSIYFLVRFHLSQRIPLGRYVLEVLARPAAAAALGGLAGHSVSLWAVWSLVPEGRAQGIARLVAGGVALIGVAAAVLMASRYVSLSEVRAIVGPAGGRPREAAG
ncbi:MAG TPA: oligosaccharide flippase family protein [Candidatus Eisenbacteria bacterium]|jgi:O-antigen/teichoic acid export membrane protein